MASELGPFNRLTEKPHSVCKTCILRYLETSNYCPICEVLIHKTRPWQNIRLDHSLQNAVYKMVPGLFQNEMRRRREFYEKQNIPDKRGRLSSQPQGELGDRIIFSQDEEFSISIEFSPDGKPVKDVKGSKAKSLKRPKVNCQPDKRYLKCPAGLRIEHLKKFIRSKFVLPQTVQIDLFYETEPLNDTFSLMDVAYIYCWKRDCVLRLFYSFYEIPSKLRKVEAVTIVTEISKSKIKGRNEEKPDKGDDDKKPKGKKEGSREKKQSKLSGKRKVSSDGTTSGSNRSSKLSQVIAAETNVASSLAQSKETDTAALKDNLSAPKNEKHITDTSLSNMDLNSNNNLVPERCSNIGDSTCQSPTKQKPPPDNADYSIIDPSRHKNRSKLSKSQDSNVSIKLLIKSSDIKDCKSMNDEAVSDVTDRLYQSSEASSKVKIKKSPSHETKSISGSNLFEKMDTFARSSTELKELTADSDSYSKSLINNKKLKEANKKCDVVSDMNITKPETIIIPTQPMDNSKPAKIAFQENVVNQGTQNKGAQCQIYCLNTDEKGNTKPMMCNVNNQMESMEKCEAVVKERTSPEIELADRDTTVVSQNGGQSTYDTKPEMHGVSHGVHLTKTGEHKQATVQKVCEFKDMDNVKQNALGFSYTSQDTNQNETKPVPLESTHNSNINKQNIFKQITEAERNSTTDILENVRQKCEDTIQNSSKQVTWETKQMTLNPKQRSSRQINTDDIRQRKVDIKQAVLAAKPISDTCLAATPKSSNGSETPISSQNLQNRIVKRPDTSSVESMTTIAKKKPRVQDLVLSKVLISTAGNRGPPQYPQGTLPVKSAMMNVKSENQQPTFTSIQQKQSSPSNKSSEISMPLSKPLTLISITTPPQVNSTLPKARVAPCQQASASSNGSLHVSSAKRPLVSGVATTTTTFPTLPAPPKLMKTTSVCSSYLSTSYAIASIVAVPSVNVSNITTHPVMGRSLVHSNSTSTTSSTAKVSWSSDVTSTVPGKLSPHLSCMTTVTNSTMVMPLISAAYAPASTPTSYVASRAKDLSTDKSVAESSTAAKLSDTTSWPSGTPSRISTSACMPSKALLDSLSAPTTAPSIAVSVTTPPVSSSTASSTRAALSLASSVAATVADSWPTNTRVNVANTFLHIPLTKSSALKDTQAKNSARDAEVSPSNMTIPKDAIKLDNFLFDTKSSEIEPPNSANSLKVKDSCTVVRQAQKSPVRPKPNSSAQLHGLVTEKSSKHAGSHITAIHQLPKTISQSSKPYSVARSISVSSSLTSKCNIIQTTKISTLIPKSASVSSKTGTFSKSFSYPSTVNNVPSSRSFLHTSLASHLPRSDLSAAINGSSGYERHVLTKTTALPSSLSLPPTSSPASSTSHHRTSTSSKHSSRDGDGKMEKTQKTKAIPPLTIPKSCLIGTTLKLQRSPGSTDHYIFAPLTHYGPTPHHNGERSKAKEVKHNGSRTPTSPPTPTKDGVFIGERQRVPTIKISDINRNPIIVESGASGNGGTRHHSPYRSYSHGSSRSSGSENGSARTHSRGGSDSSSPTGSSDKSDRSPARDARRPSDSELLMSQHWHGYSAADLLFNGFKLPTHPKFHDLHYDTDAMPLDYSQSSSKS